MENKLFAVGGCIRDHLLGLETKDIDFTYVANKGQSVAEGYAEMRTFLVDNGFEIYLETPDMYTIRARFTNELAKQYGAKDADLVLARKEIGYETDSRKPMLEIGTLEDDLRRRDFTVNAIAKDIEGNLIDPFDGQRDLQWKVLRTPINSNKTIKDDPLRILRAIRFSITKKLYIGDELHAAMINFDREKFEKTVSQERIREELYKCFKADTNKTLHLLYRYDLMFVFENNMWLKPTTEQ